MTKTDVVSLTQETIVYTYSILFEYENIRANS